MKRFAVIFSVAVVFAALAGASDARTSVHLVTSTAVAAPRDGSRDFDFEVGDWNVVHHVKRNGAWVLYTGTASNHPLMNGAANIEQQTIKRGHGTTYGVALRGYDAKTHLWSIWWLDSRALSGPLDPPVRGRFVGGVGTFYSDEIVNGKPHKTRYVWSHVTARSARWEQAYSTDGGRTWETNWIMELARRSSG